MNNNCKYVHLFVDSQIIIVWFLLRLLSPPFRLRADLRLAPFRYLQYPHFRCNRSECISILSCRRSCLTVMTHHQVFMIHPYLRWFWKRAICGLSRVHRCIMEIGILRRIRVVWPIQSVVLCSTLRKKCVFCEVGAMMSLFGFRVNPLYSIL